MDQEQNYQREINMLKMNIKVIERNTINGDKSSIVLALDKITNLLARFEMAKDELTRKMLDDGENVDSVEEWLSKPIMEAEAAIEIKNKMVDKLDTINKNECVKKFEYEKTNYGTAVNDSKRSGTSFIAKTSKRRRMVPKETKNERNI